MNIKNIEYKHLIIIQDWCIIDIKQKINRKLVWLKDLKRPQNIFIKIIIKINVFFKQQLYIYNPVIFWILNKKKKFTQLSFKQILINQIYTGHTPSLTNRLKKTSIFSLSKLNTEHMNIAEEIVCTKKYFKQGSTE